MIDWICALADCIIITSTVVDSVAPELPTDKGNCTAVDWRYIGGQLIQVQVQSRCSNLQVEVVGDSGRDKTIVHIDRLSQWGVSVRIAGCGIFSNDNIPSLKDVVVRNYKNVPNVRVYEQLRVCDGVVPNTNCSPVVLFLVNIILPYQIDVYLEFKWQCGKLSFTQYHVQPTNACSKYILTNGGYYRLRLDHNKQSIRIAHPATKPLDIKCRYEHLVYTTNVDGFAIYLGNSFAGIYRGRQFYHQCETPTKSYGFVLDRQYLIYKHTDNTMKVIDIITNRVLYNQSTNYNYIPMAYNEHYGGVLMATEDGLSLYNLIHRPEGKHDKKLYWTNELLRYQWLSDDDIVVAQFKNAITPVVAVHINPDV